MHLLCKHVAVTREDGWKEELVTHSGAIQLRESLSLSLSGVVIDGRTTDVDSALSAKRVMYRVHAPRVGLMEKTHTGSRLC